MQKCCYISTNVDENSLKPFKMQFFYSSTHLAWTNSQLKPYFETLRCKWLVSQKICAKLKTTTDKWKFLFPTYIYFFIYTLWYYLKINRIYIKQQKHMFSMKKLIFVSISKMVGDIKKRAPMSNIYFLFCISWWYLKSDRTYIKETCVVVKNGLNESS